MNVQGRHRIAVIVGGAIAVVSMGVPAAAGAQDVTGRVALEAVVSGSVTSKTVDDPFLVFDAIGTIHVGGGWDAIIRPWAKRRAGVWGAEMYQLQMRYTSSTRVPFRFDAGIISSPLGLATLELGADRNPTVGNPFYYFVPLPAFDGRFDRVNLMSGGYPLGAVFSVSGTRWDARGGVTDGTPSRARSIISEYRAAAQPQLVAGGGVTPIAGLRFGAGFARGGYRTGDPVSGRPTPAASATVFNLEGEYAVGYTRVAGEWVLGRFETTISPAVARGFNLVATRTLSPRWFAAGRAVRASSPVLSGRAPGRRTATSAEGTLGYRLTPDFTLRGGYQGSTSFNRPKWEHALVVSGVWARRWW
jgi:hypothetical protein